MLSDKKDVPLADWEFHFHRDTDYVLKNGTSPDASAIEMLTGHMKGSIFEISHLQFLDEGENGDNASYTYNVIFLPENRTEDELIPLMNDLIADLLVDAIQSNSAVYYNNEGEYNVVIAEDA